MGITVAYQPSAQVIGDASFAIGQGALRERQQAMAQQAALQRQAQRAQMQSQAMQIEAQQKRDAQQAFVNQAKDAEDRAGRLEYLKAQHGYMGEEQDKNLENQRALEAARAAHMADLKQQEAEAAIFKDRVGDIRKGRAGIQMQQQINQIETELARAQANEGGLPQEVQALAVQQLMQKRNQLVSSAQIQKPPTEQEELYESFPELKNPDVKWKAPGVQDMGNGTLINYEKTDKGWKKTFHDTPEVKIQAKQEEIKQKWEAHQDDLYKAEVNHVQSINHTNDDQYTKAVSEWKSNIRKDADSAYKEAKKDYDSYRKEKAKYDQDQAKPALLRTGVANPGEPVSPPQPRSYYLSQAEQEHEYLKPEREPALPVPSRDDFLAEKKGRGPQQVAAAMGANPHSMAAQGPQEAPTQAAPKIPSVPVTSKLQDQYQPILKAAVKAGEMTPEQATDLNELYSKRGIPAPSDAKTYAMIPAGSFYIKNGKLMRKKAT